MTTESQDSGGLQFEWFEPLVRNPKIIELVTGLLGPNVCASGWRVLAKDKHYTQAVHIHQDWPYNMGGYNKVSVFVPLTRVNFDNGGLVFLEESHLYGPVSMGPLDPSRFDPMEEVCPSLEVGDILLCDYLTWHYSPPSGNGEERIMLQLNYQPASDGSYWNLVAGEFPHRRWLAGRFEASSAPSVELNAKRARSYFEAGEVDRAERYARGLIGDDKDHGGAALLLYDALSSRGDPTAIQYLEMARTSAANLQKAVAQRDRALGIETADPQETSAPSGASSRWKKIDTAFKSFVPTHGDAACLPAAFGTPAGAWCYGASSDPVETTIPANIRIKARSLKGTVGFALVKEDFSGLASEQHAVSPEAGDSTIILNLLPANSPARVTILNFGGDGVEGEVEIESVEIFV